VRKTMVALPVSEAALLRAAEGWLELGDCLSAFEELETIPPLHRAHVSFSTDFLELERPR